MKNSFWGLIWSSLREVNNSILTILSYGLSILLAVVAGKASVPLYIVIIIVTVALLAIATFFRALETALKEYRKLEQSAIPRILRVKKNHNNQYLFLLEASNLFSTGTMISLYHNDEDGFDILIGIGFIEHIRSDGKIQAIIDQPIQPHQSIIDRILANDSKFIERTIVRPNIPKGYSSL